MLLTDSVHLFQLVNALGMTAWLLIAAFNNVHAFFGAVGAVGATMSMTPLRQAPAITTPLLARNRLAKPASRPCCWCLLCRSWLPSRVHSAAITWQSATA